MNEGMNKQFNLKDDFYKDLDKLFIKCYNKSYDR